MMLSISLIVCDVLEGDDVRTAQTEAMFMAIRNWTTVRINYHDSSSFEINPEDMRACFKPVMQNE